MHQAKKQDDDFLMSIAETAAMCGRSRSGLSKIRVSDQSFPKAVKLSGSTARNARVGFWMSEVQAYIESKR